MSDPVSAVLNREQQQAPPSLVDQEVDLVITRVVQPSMEVFTSKKAKYPLDSSQIRTNGFLCLQCEEKPQRVFKTLQALRLHERSHSGEVGCSQCNVICKNQNALGAHIGARHPEQTKKGTGQKRRQGAADSDRESKRRRLYNRPTPHSQQQVIFQQDTAPHRPGSCELASLPSERSLVEQAATILPLSQSKKSQRQARQEPLEAAVMPFNSHTLPIDPLGLGPHSQTASTTFDLCDLLTPSQWTTPLSDQRAAPASCSSTRQPTEAPLDFLSWGVQSQLRAARTSPGYDLPEQSQVAGVPGFGVSPAAHLALTAAPLPITDAGLTRPLDAPPSDEELLHTLQEFSRDAGYEFFHEIEKEFDEQLIPENIAASIPFDLPLHDDRDTSPSTSFSRVTPSAHSASSAYVTPPIRAHEPQTLERDSQFFDPNKLGKNNNFQCYHCDVRWVGNMASLIEHLVTHYAADPNRNPFSPLLREYEDRIQAKLPRNQIKEVK